MNINKYKKPLALSLMTLIFTISACQNMESSESPVTTTISEENATDSEKIIVENIPEEVDESISVEETDIIDQRVILGNERFDEYLPLLEGKKVALFTNQTGIVGNIEGGDHILDALLERDVNVVAVFCPEHGFRGTEDAGADIESSVDEKTGVPLLSLYSSDKTHEPAAEDMDKFDILIIDMQDVGLRYYTYYISMYYLMDACAKYDKEVMILDRPNPNGFYVEGPILKEDYKSGVGQLPIPVVYGMTWGELGQMINGEGWLKAGENACKLTVIPCENYTHQTKTSLIVNPSPNIRTMKAVYLYSSLCFFENTLVSVGRGTDTPFEVYGSPYLTKADGYEYAFTPESVAGATNPPFLGETCFGVSFASVSLDEISSQGINLSYLIDAYNTIHAKYPDESFWGTPDADGRYWIDLLSGSDALRNQIESGLSEEEIKDSWKSEEEAFLEQRRPYLLYEE